MLSWTTRVASAKQVLLIAAFLAIGLPGAGCAGRPQEYTVQSFRDPSDPRLSVTISRSDRDTATVYTYGRNVIEVRYGINAAPLSRPTLSVPSGWRAASTAVDSDPRELARAGEQSMRCKRVAGFPTVTRRHGEFATELGTDKATGCNSIVTRNGAGTVVSVVERDPQSTVGTPVIVGPDRFGGSPNAPDLAHDSNRR
jgi:hypothetical protein